MSYNYISGQSNVLTGPQARSNLASKLQSCSISSPISQGGPQSFKPFTKVPACEFNFRTPNYFYPPQHTHSLSNSYSKGFKGRVNSGGRNVSFDEVFRNNQSSTPQITITKQQMEVPKHVTFNDSVLGHSHAPKSPIANAPKVPPRTLPKPQNVSMGNALPSSPGSGGRMEGSFSPSNGAPIHPGSMMESRAGGPQQGMNQSFYQESSSSTFQSMTSSQSSNNSPGTQFLPPNEHQLPKLGAKPHVTSSPAEPSRHHQTTLSAAQLSSPTPGSNLRPIYANDRNVSPTPFGEPKRNSSPFRHVNAPRMEAPTGAQRGIPPPPPPPSFGTSRMGHAPPTTSSSFAPFAPMEMNELSPVVKETIRSSSPGEPIFLENGEVIPSDTKIMVKDQNAWYRQMSKTIHGLKGDMPMNRVASWPKP